MVDPLAIRSLINRAINTKSTVSIRYRDYNNNISERTIIPQKWVGQNKIKAHCLLRNEERHFRIENIINISQSNLSSYVIPDSISSPIQAKTSQDSTQPISVSYFSESTNKLQDDKPSFSKVNSAETWKSLLEYYTACLNYEYQQNFSFYKSALEFLDINEDDILSFLSGKTHLVINIGKYHNKLKEFLDSSNKRNKQLCLGKSFVQFSDEQITPLLFAPVTASQINLESILLKPEELNLSYAVLMKLNYSPEDIAEFQSFHQEFLINQSPVEDIEQFVLNSISKDVTIFENEFANAEIIRQVPTSKYLNKPGLFWVDNRFTGNLINDLEDLSHDFNWHKAPKIINYLVNDLPKHSHESPPEFIDDKRFYVTDINDQQRKSTYAVSGHPVTIITGPPGTGKSQLVLNLIAQAFLKGKTVLFASHNNKAVNVVMDRLQDEIQFQGAIRTGTREYRKKAIVQMKSALSQTQRVELEEFQIDYEKGKTALKRSAEELAKIRDLNGKILSYQNEKDEVLSKIPTEWRDLVSTLNFSFNENEKSRINKFLSGALAELRQLIEQRKKLIKELRFELNEKKEKYPALQVFEDYELKWGEFADGLVQKSSFSSLSELQEHVNHFLAVLDALSITKDYHLIKSELINLQRQIEKDSERLSDAQKGTMARYAERNPNELIVKHDQIIILNEALRKLQNNKFSLFYRVLIALHIINPLKRFFQNFNMILDDAGFDDLFLSKSDHGLPHAAKSFETYQLLLHTSTLLQKFEQKKNEEVKLKIDLSELTARIPVDIIKSFEKFDLENFSSTALEESLKTIQKKAAILEIKLLETLKTCSNFFVDNEEDLNSIRLFGQLPKTGHEEGPFEFNNNLTEEQAYHWATTFRRALVVWEANSIIAYSKDQLNNLPDEKQALENYKSANSSLFNIAGKLMRASWFNRSSEASNEVFKGTQQYISAVDQLNNLNYGQEPNLYRTLKDSERSNFKNAFQMFPVWAITNLTARTNFPLESGLFDLFIIDEASQCDIPSAIPLLYRAKKVVIIGDPNQLRHVSTLNNELDKTLGEKHQVGLEAFSYVSTSLYDLGARSVGQHPGPILLDEHYRSDPRIIQFSNKAFYGNKLKIKTDLTQRGFEKSFVNQCGGIHWINVKGKYERPPSGRSAFNNEELEQLETLIPRLLHELPPKTNLGIVTPFRAQEDRIKKWLGDAHGSNERIISGTAHQFQGDERDVIIFSPVLSEGIAQGTLSWLETTYNLLNVAITRARLNLIVIGDFDYCYQKLKPQSIYAQLAKYVKEQLNGIYSEIDDLPILGGEQFEILGTILDPSNPEYNRTNLLRFIRSCKGYLDWVDPYFNQEIIDLFDDLYEQEPYPKIKSYRLLTAERQVKVSSAKLRPESIESLQSHLSNFGVEFNMRVLPGEQLPHDRFLYHQDGAINMPPFSGAYGSHRHISEYTASHTERNLFDQHWEKAVSVVDLY